MQPAPRTQIYETIICDTLFPSADKDLERCKADIVQEELVFAKGTERLLGAFPSEYRASAYLCLVLLSLC